MLPKRAVGKATADETQCRTLFELLAWQETSSREQERPEYLLQNPTRPLDPATSIPLPKLTLREGHHRANTGAKDSAKGAGMLLLTWTWRTVVPTVVFSRRLTL